MINWLNKHRLGILVFILYLTSLVFIYPFSNNNFGGDSTYYGWIKDIYKYHYGYFSWTTPAGYNLFSIVYVFSLLTGYFTYNSPVVFFLIANCSELILLLLLSLAAIRLIKIDEQNFTRWVFLLPPCIIIWTIISLLASPPSQILAIQATDLYMLFVDTFIILHIGLFINILNDWQKQQKTSYTKYIIFIAFSFYFASTTLRFINGAFLSELSLLAIFFLRGRHVPPKAATPNCYVTNSNYASSIAIILVLIAVVGYYGFFMLEVFSSSARFVLRGGEVTTREAWQNGLTALNQYFSGFRGHDYTFLLRSCYLITLAYGVYTLCTNLFTAKKINLKQLFAILTCINFVLVTLAGLFSHGTVFLDVGAIAHYYELSAIFAFLSVTAAVIDLLNKFSYQLVAIISLTLTSIFGISYTATHTVEFPLTDLVNCINANQQQYKLKDGLGFWALKDMAGANPKNNLHYNILGERATNLDYNWQSNMSLPNQDSNFLVYADNQYKDRALSIINSKTPGVKYHEVSCTADSGILVFDQASTDYINKFRAMEYANAKAWFYITNYGSGQSLWAKMSWNQAFIKKYHEYNYYGSLLRRTSGSVQYTVNPDLSITVNGSTQGPVLATEMIHAGAGRYSINANYITNSGGGLFVVDLSTNRPIANLNLTPDTKNARVDFSLYQTTPIALMIALPEASSSFTLQTLTFGKVVANN